MSIRDCIDGKVAGKRLRREQADAMLDLFDELRAQRAASMAPEMVDATAAADVVAALRRATAAKKRQALLQIQATDRIATALRSHPNGTASAAMSLLVRDVTDRAGYANVDMRQRTVRGALHAKWADGLAELGKRGLGIRQDKASLRAVIRELFGEDSGDATAKELARTWSEAAEYARRRFNAAGGDIPKRENWGLPHRHDSRAVQGLVVRHRERLASDGLAGRALDAAARDAAADEWIGFVEPLLDRAKMLDDVTGMPISPERLRLMLGRMFDRIRTDGLIDLAPGQAGTTKLANRHADHRFLVFRDAESWMAYNERFGKPDLFGALVDHLDGMAKDIGLMEVLGPNPDAMLRFIVGSVRKDAAIRAVEPGHAPKTIEDTYKVLTDRIGTPVSKPLANLFTGLRNVLTAAQLGGAFLSSLTDIGFQRLARSFNGLPAVSVLKDYVNLIAREGDKRAAVRLGLIAESWSETALAAARYTGETTGPEISRRLSDVILRATLLTPWTDAGRHAFGMEFLATLAEHADRAIEAMPEPLRRAFRRYGIEAADWDAIRAAPRFEHRGVGFVRAENVAEAGHVEAANKLMQMVFSEMEFAVPTVDARVRAIMTQGTQPGTVGGELIRSVALYKSFPVAVLTTHMMRGLAQDGHLQRGKYIADLVISLGVFGALAYQAKQIQRGRDPVEMDPSTDAGRRFWAAALAQGGGLGLFGDFLFSDANRFGRGPVMSFAGPVFEFGDSTAQLILGNLQQLLRGEETNVAAEAVRYASRYTPGSSIWYARLALERLVLDELERMADPDAPQRFRRIEARAREEMGQRFWWRPGQTAPARGPDLEAALGP